MSDYEYDSGNESSNEEDDDDLEEDDGVLLALEPENNPAEADSLDYDDYPHSVFNCDQIIEEMIATIREVNTVVQLPQTITRILLNHFKWDKEKLYEHYYAGDQEKLFCEARIVNPNKSVQSSSSGSSSSSSNNSTNDSYFSQKSSRIGYEFCVICCAEFQTSLMTGIACGHRFCKDCWTHYLTTKIMEEGQGQTISCAAHGCDILVDDQTVFALITDSVKLRYQQLITNSYVECNRLLRWCPKPECSRVIRVEYVDFKPVKCLCNSVFCFLCAENWHEPIKCDLLKRWKKKCDDDSETSNWIAANTKECPRCQVTIEKDGGCNHMICKNSSCQFHFCWVCLGPWAPHGSSWYSCNRFDEDEAKAARDAQEKSRSALQRYLFYCNRYMNAMQSLKFENKLYELVKAKMEEMQHHNMSWIEVQFLHHAVDILCQCRQTLMYTYVFAYYLVKNNQSIIFEDNQKDLESATEKLSEYLERDITQDNISAIKQKVQDKSRYCESRRRVLLNHVKEGYDKDLWEYLA